MTLPEVLLWRELRKRPAGLRFRRQHPIGDHVLDFLCVEARLAIEVDGRGHGLPAHVERDSARDAQLARRGIRTLRVAAADVLRDVQAVLERIDNAARATTPLHRFAVPLPLPGEDLRGAATEPRP